MLKSLGSSISSQEKRKSNKYHKMPLRPNMECAVYDTYVTKKDGKIMHFDVVVDASTPHEKAIEYGKEYLSTAGQDGAKMTQKFGDWTAHLDLFMNDNIIWK